MVEAAAGGAHVQAHGEPSASDIRLVIAASSAGTIFEWYDFFIYGTLASIIGKTFFPADSETLQLLLVWAGFAVGFGFRPLGAILFGYWGDKLGRKYTFLVTVTLMGIATAGVGLIPSAASIGVAAPLIIILLRILQGLALGGEYGGAAIYVAEHAPPNKRGYYTGYIQASVVGGFVLSVIVVLACRYLIPADVFADWGWRLPFVLSLALLAVSLYMRLKLNESPVFKAMRAAGEIAGNPFVESFTYPGNKKRIFVALFGVTGGLTTIWYTAFFSSLSFLKGPMRVDETTAEITVGLAGLVAMGFYVFVGALSDKVGRKKPIIWGNALTLLLLFPLFWGIGHYANPALAEAARREPVSVAGPDCAYDPFASEQPTNCGKLLSDLTALGVSYDLVRDGNQREVGLTIGSRGYQLGGPTAAIWADKKARTETLKGLLERAGYNFAKQTPPLGSLVLIGGLLCVLGALSALTYASVAALLTEMFPAKIRYSSMSIPYHIGAGYLGGFLPLIASYIVAKTGNAYSGLWYTWAVVLVALVVAWWGLKGGPPREFEDDA
ncbi:MFS transporter [Novosphingobium sp. 9U]|uniref:MFS transporter n=1 Tax=Novosphingobium sp. 9U TaxID=2653158 RepID=UPI0012F07EC5|nr:MFS transporter [Novosphingobium sp. 9U]VWX51651.1 MFS transporter [Novosphingobium sp. 9U]